MALRGTQCKNLSALQKEKTTQKNVFICVAVAIFCAPCAMVCAARAYTKIKGYNHERNF
jgi:hypothetical protein